MSTPLVIVTVALVWVICAIVGGAVSHDYFDGRSSVFGNRWTNLTRDGLVTLTVLGAVTGILWLPIAVVLTTLGALWSTARAMQRGVGEVFRLVFPKKPNLPKARAL